MMQYPNQYYQNQHACNTENCKRCYKKQGCPQYLSYLENIAMTPIAQSTTATLSSSQLEPDAVSFAQANIDLSVVSELISTSQNSNVELIANYSIDMGNKFKSLLELNDRQFAELSEMKSKIVGLNEKISRLDSFIEMIELHNAQSADITPDENSVAIYSEAPEKEKTLVAKTKKGLFGLGKEKTEWVEE